MAPLYVFSSFNVSPQDVLLTYQKNILDKKFAVAAGFVLASSLTFSIVAHAHTTAGSLQLFPLLKNCSSWLCAVALEQTYVTRRSATSRCVTYPVKHMGLLLRSGHKKRKNRIEMSLIAPPRHTQLVKTVVHAH